MNEEKRVYSIVGTVTIGTDEYRDLLTEKFEALKEKDEWHDKWYKEYTEARALEKQVKSLKEKLSQYEQLIKKHTITISQDDISIFTSLSGEE